MKKRHAQRGLVDGHSRDSSWGYRESESLNVPHSPMAPAHPGAVELPAEDDGQRTPTSWQRTPGNPPYPFEGSGAMQDKYSVISGDSNSSRVSSNPPYRFGDDDKFTYQPPSNSAYNPSEPPPRPPKTPINEPAYPAHRPSPGRTNGAQRPPYPVGDDLPAPPLVSKLRKPEFIPRSA